MNKQRKVLITITYNEMGIIIDTKAEEVAQPEKPNQAEESTQNVPNDDLVFRKEAIDAIFSEPLYESGMKKRDADVVVPAIYKKIKSLPSAHPKISCDGCRYRGWPTTDMPCYGCMRKEDNDYYTPE